jgi:hypothetical protein
MNKPNEGIDPERFTAFKRIKEFFGSSQTWRGSKTTVTSKKEGHAWRSINFKKFIDG